MNIGTSPNFSVTGEDFSETQSLPLTDFSLEEVKPPSISDNTNVTAITKWINPCPEISFAKIAYPKYDGICQYNCVISNNPDFVQDWHFIGIMRCVDYYIAPEYIANIRVRVTSPTFVN